MRCPKFTLADAKRVMPQVRLPRGITPRAFLVGLNVEREHKDVTRCALLGTGKIAARHFWEGKDYYRKLITRVEGKRYVE
jgi:hypothetical protein